MSLGGVLVRVSNEKRRTVLSNINLADGIRSVSFLFLPGIRMKACLCLLFLRLTYVATQVAWENCPSGSNTMKLLNLTIRPYPIAIPGSISVELTIRNEKPVETPLKVDLSLHKKILFSSVSIPCIGGIGSCTYDDLCRVCPQCGCPMQAGDHVITLPITIDTTSWALAGSYQAQVDVQSSSGEKGCVKLHNIHITSSK